MKKSVQFLFSITVFFTIMFIGLPAASKVKETPGDLGKNSPVISEKVKQKVEAGEEVPVLIKLKEEWEHPSVKKMTTASDPAHFISKQDIKRLQKVLESSFSPKETNKDIKVHHKLENIPWITGKINRKALVKLKVHPNVAIITEDTRVQAHLAQSGPLINSDFVHQDPGYGYTGSGGTVAVIDTGIDTDHPDLQDHLIWEECFLFAGGCPKTGGHTASGPGSAEDGHGHGTHVSGIITSGHATYTGIAPDAKIVALKMLDDSGSGWTSDRIAAIDWVVSNKDTYGINVINMSIGTNSQYTGICDSYQSSGAASADAAKAAGIVLFASSGNDAVDAGITDPACLSSVVSVGATYDADVGYMHWIQSGCTDSVTDTDQIACFSNVSSELDLLAPGSRIISSGLGGGVSDKSGTSMASPHAAALAALIIDKNSFLTPDEIEEILKNSGDSIFDARIGLSFPRIEAQGALDITPDPDPTLTLDTAGPGSGTVTGADTYNYGETATITVTGDYGSAFDVWTGPDAAECSTGSVVMVADKSCTANFIPDNCPDDPLKIVPGICGCGVADTDTDSDTILDCNDTDDDNDGMPDVYEVTEGFNPLDASDAGNDPDGDRLTNLAEYNSGTYPNDIDSDNDGIADGLDAYPFDDQQSWCANLIQNDISLENFTTVQAAVEDLSANDYDVIQITAADFGENVLYDRDAILTLSGGYYCNFTISPSTTLINSLIIRNGTIMVENIIIQ